MRLKCYSRLERHNTAWNITSCSRRFFLSGDYERGEENIGFDMLEHIIENGTLYYVSRKRHFFEQYTSIYEALDNLSFEGTTLKQLLVETDLNFETIG